MAEFSNKTVFVLDHGPYFAKPSRQIIDIDLSARSRYASLAKAVQYNKSLWTCSVEAAFEYARIVRDLYPNKDKLVRFAVCDSGCRFLTPSWDPEEQSNEKLIEAFSKLGPPSPTEESEGLAGMLSALSLAIESLTTVTNPEVDSNSGRVVCLTHFERESDIQELVDHALETLITRNKLIANLEDSESKPIDKLWLCFVNVHPLKSEDKQVSKNSTEEISPSLTLEIVTTESGQSLESRIHGLLLNHYDLSSTTVTGIPMKEEQNASTSANYDVELFHPRSAHGMLCRGGYLKRDSALLAERPGGYQTITLKWCSPTAKGAQAEQFYLCDTAVRITPAEVNSRPSACLTNFILSGRTVLLEVPNRKVISSTSLGQGKHLSHMLTNHGGHAFIHGLTSHIWSRSEIEEPPLVADGVGGRVMDYRVSDMMDLLREARLGALASDSSTVPRPEAHLRRLTSGWPMLASETVLFNSNATSKLDPLIRSLRKSSLTEQDVTEARRILLMVKNLENAVELPLIPPTATNKLKNLKREEQFTHLWQEVRQLLRANGAASLGHRAVVDAFTEMTGLTVDLDTTILNPEEKMDESGPLEIPSTKRLKLGQKVNLLAKWTELYQVKHWSNWRDFDGRVSGAELYHELMEKFRQSAREAKFVVVC